MSRVRYTDSAEADLRELWLTIAEDNPVAADGVLDSIQATVTLLCTQPEMGRTRPELVENMRSFPTPTRYVVFYLPDAQGDLLVVRVLHHACDIDRDYFV